MEISCCVALFFVLFSLFRTIQEQFHLSCIYKNVTHVGTIYRYWKSTHDTVHTGNYSSFIACRDVQFVVSPEVWGPLSLCGGVHRASYHALQKWEIPLLPPLQSPRWNNTGFISTPSSNWSKKHLNHPLVRSAWETGRRGENSYICTIFMSTFRFCIMLMWRYLVIYVLQ